MVKVDLSKGVLRRGTKFKDLQDYFMRGIAYGSSEIQLKGARHRSFVTLSETIRDQIRPGALETLNALEKDSAGTDSIIDYLQK